MLVETKHLFIREIQPNDREELLNILQNKKVMRQVDIVFDEIEVDEWMKKQMENYHTIGFGMWVVVLKKTKQVIGICGLTLRSFKNELFHEISYYFHPSFWHHGYATEAVNSIIAFSFETLNIDHIISIMKDSNLSSIKMARRCHMKLIDKYHQYVEFKRQLLLIYSIRKEHFLCYNREHEND